MHPYPVNEANCDAVMVKCESFVKNGMFDWEAEADFDPEACYSPCFKAKKGRTDPGTGFTDQRMLCNFVVVNNMTVDEVKHASWKKFGPTVERFMTSYNPADC
jgi:hypothetical protein